MKVIKERYMQARKVTEELLDGEFLGDTVWLYRTDFGDPIWRNKLCRAVALFGHPITSLPYTIREWYYYEVKYQRSGPWNLIFAILEIGVAPRTSVAMERVTQGLCAAIDMIRENPALAQQLGVKTRCQSDSYGDCSWNGCPQLRDNEPKTSGRHCPLDVDEDDD